MNDSDPAFPRSAFYHDNGCSDHEGQKGMSLRDWFAGMALQDYRARSKDDSDTVVKWCYHDADAMLAERQKNVRG